MSFLNAARLGLSYQLKAAKLSYPPPFIYLEPTSSCNLMCPMCPVSDKTTYRKGEFMDMDLFESLARQMEVLKPNYVVFHLGGEPLLNPDLPTMIRRIHGMGIRTTLSTNGVLLHQRNAELLIDAGLDLIRVDFYSDKRRFEAMRRGAGWEIVKNNIAVFLAAKRSRAVMRPALRIKSLHFKNDPVSSSLEMEAIRAHFPGMRIEEIEVQEVHSFSGAFADGVKEDPRYKIPRQRGRYYPCRHAWSGIAIQANGDAVPCCRDLLGSYILGSARETSIEDLWNSEKYVDLREKQIEGRCGEISICRNCTAPWEGMTPYRLMRRALREKLSSYLSGGL